MKYYLLKFCRRIPVQQLNYRIIYLLIVAIISLISVFIIHNLLLEKAIAIKPETELICRNTANSSPEELSKEGEKNYRYGQFDKAVECWKKAVAGYEERKNTTETINNRIKLAQAEQALGLFPRACNTLLEIYDEENCKILLEDKLEDKENKEDNFFNNQLSERATSVSKIAGLRPFGNILRKLGELERSNQVLLLSLDKSPSEEQAAIWLDLGNTRRALSNKERDLYQRSEEEENLVCGIINAYAATQAYKKAGEIGSNSPSAFNNIKLQSKLNELSLVLDLQDWNKNKFSTQRKAKENILEDALEKLINPNDFLVYKAEECWNFSGLNQPEKNFTNDILDEDPTNLSNLIIEYELIERIRPWLFEQLSEQNPLTQLAQINQLQQQIEQLPKTHAALFTRLNFAKNLIRIENFPTTRIDKFLVTSTQYANDLGDSNAESYSYGYLGELYEKRGEFELAKKYTKQALLIAQSTAIASQTEYLWEWQLGRIYKSQITEITQAQTKGIQETSLNNLNNAQEMYELAYQTLQSLRRELVDVNLDIKFTFQNDIEKVYRDYVSLMLWDQNLEQDEQEKISKAREVIASLQAVQLENFLRVACPEYNVEEIDTIVDEYPNTAFLYPIVLEDKDLGDRIEVIVKLPNQAKLVHYHQKIDANDFEEEIRNFQINLEEDYTFENVKEEGKKLYDILLGKAENIIEEYDKQQQNKENKINTLVFALDTNLRNIPLAALVVDDRKDPPTYLIDKYALALAPSLEIPKPPIVKDKKLRVLAAGLTKLDREKYEQSFQEEVKQYRELDFAKTEIEKIRNINAIENKKEKDNYQISVDELIDDKFITDELQDELKSSNFQIIHLATHGQFSSSSEKTFLLTYNEPILVNELDDIFRIQLQNQLEPIELIVLNACETATGDSRATLGISGVAVRAGARSAIASLWALDDEITAQFSEKLYEQLVNPNLTKAKALQEAQIELKKNTALQHPKFWAPYILVGNWL